MSMYLRKRVILVVFVYAIIFFNLEVITTKFINSIWYIESLYQQFIFRIFDGLERLTFYTIDFSLSLEIKSLDILP